jgi:hypothetical protein
VNDYTMLPEHMREGARLYVEEGLDPGGFLRAVLENNLTESFARADGIDLAHIADWVEWLYWQIPAPAWRCSDNISARGNVEKWMKHQGMKGWKVTFQDIERALGHDASVKALDEMHDSLVKP